MPFDIKIERQTVLTCEPHLTALSFMTKHENAVDKYGENLPKNFIASTDGNTTWYGPEYAAMDRAGKNFIFVHELMHGIFMHPKRTMLLKLRYGFVYPSLSNYAADAIINEAIIANPAMMRGLFDMPRAFPGVLMKTIHDAVKEAHKLTGEKYPSDYDPEAKGGQQMEVVYSWLVWAHDVVKNHRKKNECPECKQPKPKKSGQKSEKGQKEQSDSGQGNKSEQGDAKQGEGLKSGNSSSTCTKCGQEKGQSSGQGGQGGKGNGGESGQSDQSKQKDPSELTQIEKMAGETAWDIEQNLEDLQKALENGETPSSVIDKLNRVIDEARSRIQAIVQGAKLSGTGSGNILLSLENDLPQAVIPWNRKLRKLITCHLVTKMDDSYTRFGSTTRAAIAMRQRRIPFSPGTTIFTERPRVLVVMDVSGSHISQLNQCMAEINAIARMKSAAVDVITFDDGVQQKFEIKNKSDLRKILNEGLRGAGGTSLNGVFEDINKMQTPYKACVIMTDGYLCPPTNNTKKISIAWMITAGGTSQGLEEHGEVIYLPDYSAEAVSQKNAA